MSIEHTINELVEKCIAARGNKSLFAKHIAEVGEQLGGAFKLYDAVHNDLAAVKVLKGHPAFANYKRVTNNVALLSVKLVLEPENKADNKACSDYARVLRYAVEHRLNVDQFIEIFRTGRFRNTLKAARDADSKRLSKVRSSALDKKSVVQKPADTSGALNSAPPILIEKSTAGAVNSLVLPSHRLITRNSAGDDVPCRLPDAPARWMVLLSLPDRDGEVVLGDVVPPAMATRLMARDRKNLEVRAIFRAILVSALKQIPDD